VAWEKKHATLNKDPAYYNHKHNRCGYRYEIALKVYFDQIAWIKGLSGMARVIVMSSERG
jgi:hypothetical protein